MDVLWTKEKYHKIFCPDNIIFHASGDGATAGRCCRLCGADNNLKRFVDKYQLNGEEGQYNQLLYDCFGVTVSPPESLICEWCVRQLINTGKFRALVYAAFGIASLTNVSRCDSAKSSKKADDNDPAVITYRDMIDLLNTKAGTKRVRINTIGKRTNVQCAVCKQKYPHIIQSGDEEFVCSRCKKNGARTSTCSKCNVVMPYKMIREHMELHATAKLRRRNGLQKKSSSTKNQEKTVKIRNVPKYKCPVCPKRYMTAQHLTEHIKCMHSTNNKSYCQICGKDIKESFDKHIQTHAEQVANFQCPPKSIRTKSSLKMHRIAREK